MTDPSSDGKWAIFRVIAGVAAFFVTFYAFSKTVESLAAVGVERVIDGFLTCDIRYGSGKVLEFVLRCHIGETNNSIAAGICPVANSIRGGLHEPSTFTVHEGHATKPSGCWY